MVKTSGKFITRPRKLREEFQHFDINKHGRPISRLKIK